MNHHFLPISTERFVFVLRAAFDILNSFHRNVTLRLRRIRFSVTVTTKPRPGHDRRLRRERITNHKAPTANRSVPEYKRRFAPVIQNYPYLFPGWLRHTYDPF